MERFLKLFRRRSGRVIEHPPGREALTQADALCRQARREVEGQPWGALMVGEITAAQMGLRRAAEHLPPSIGRG